MLIESNGKCTYRAKDIGIDLKHSSASDHKLDVSISTGNESFNKSS